MKYENNVAKQMELSLKNQNVPLFITKNYYNIIGQIEIALEYLLLYGGRK